MVNINMTILQIREINIVRLNKSLGLSMSNALGNWSFQDFYYVLLIFAQGHWILFREKATA